jgi:sugar/nucleoside kinase (ribokinase family)
MQGMKGLFIGLNTIDMQFLVDAYPGKNEKSKAQGYGLYTGGPATNAAIAFSHLGGKSHLVSSFGRHPFTELIAKELQKYGVEHTDMTPERSCHPVFASVVTTLGTGERSIVSYHPNYHHFCDITLDSFPVEAYGIMLTDSFYVDAALTLTEKAHGRIPVVLDGGSWKPNLEKLLPLVDVAICSADFRPPGTHSVQHVFDFLSGQCIRNIVITQGEKPILVKAQGSYYEIPVEPIKAKDTLGAGDIFHGAFCYYYMMGSELNKALSQASMVAGRSCLAYGTREWMGL